MLLDQDMDNQKKKVESCIYRSRKAPLSKPRLVRLSGQAIPKENIPAKGAVGQPGKLQQEEWQREALGESPEASVRGYHNSCAFDKTSPILTCCPSSHPPKSLTPVF